MDESQAPASPGEAAQAQTDGAPGPETTAEPSSEDEREVVGYLIGPGLAVGLVSYLGAQPYDEVLELIDGLKSAPAFFAETADDSVETTPAPVLTEAPGE